MTLNQYRRLSLVAAPVLLCLGFAVAAWIAPFNGYQHIMCGPSMFDREKCRSIGWEQFADRYREETPAWFDIHLQKDSNASIEGSRRIISGASIISASPFAGHTADVAEYMNTFAGRPAVVVLGIEGDTKSFELPNVVVLYCNSLTYFTANEFISMCYGDSWSGSVRYQASESDHKMLLALRSSILEALSERDHQKFLHWATILPFFLVSYFFLSAIAWLFLRAIRFVRNG